MKLLHTSDWHFGKSAPVIGDYSEEQTSFLDQITEIIRGESIDAVLCAGDIYDSAKVAASAVSLYSKTAGRICCDLKKPLVVIAGNHDSAERLTACDELLQQAGLYVRGRLVQSLQPVLLDDGKVAVYAIPFFQPVEAAALWPEDGIRGMTEAVTALLDRIRAEMDPNRCNVLMMHLSVTGAELSDSDRSAVNTSADLSSSDGHFVGGSASVSAALFHGFDYVALGHIHKPQQLADNICYSGSPVAYSFGRQESQQKGVWIFDTEDHSLVFRPVHPLHQRCSVTCTYDEAVGRTDLIDAYLKLTITDRLSSMELASALADRFPYLMEISGRQSEASGTQTSLSSTEVKAMHPRQILQSFLKDVFDQPLEDDLAELFIEAYEAAGKEIDA